MKTLIIIAHPSITESRINNAWIRELRESAPEATLHDLYEKYPDGNIDVEAEQALILAHDAIVFQFPFYWFSTPSLLKRWFDDVLVPGFAYGPNREDRKLTATPIGFAVSAGIKSEDYSDQGRYKYTMKELMAPLHAVASYIGAKALSPYIFYGAEYEPGIEEIEDSANEYVQYIQKIQAEEVPEFA